MEEVARPISPYVALCKCAFQKRISPGIVFTGGRVHSERLSCKIARTQCDIYLTALIFIGFGGPRNLRTRDAIGIYSHRDSNITGSAWKSGRRMGVGRGERRNPLRDFVRLILFFRNRFSIRSGEFWGI